MHIIEVTSTSITTVRLEKETTQKIQSWRMLLSCRHWGKRLANSSITSLILISMSLWKQSKDKDVRRLLAMVDLRDVLIRFSPLNDLSELWDVTGRVQSISSKTLMLANIDEVWGNVRWSLVGRKLIHALSLGLSISYTNSETHLRGCYQKEEKKIETQLTIPIILRTLTSSSELTTARFRQWEAQCV